MKKILLAFAVVVFLASCGSTSKTGSTGSTGKADRSWSYEIESLGVGAEGTYAIRVWSYYRNTQLPLETAKKNAIHGVLFKGVPAGAGAVAQPPMVTAEQHQANTVFFDSFFNSDYQRFINSVAVGGKKIIKSGRQYKIGYAMTVSKDELRKYLEQQGIIRGLSTGF